MIFVLTKGSTSRVTGAGLCAVESAQVIARRSGEAQLVANEVVEHGAGIAADRAVRFVRDDEIEVGRREELLVLVVEQQGLHGSDDNLRASPVVPPVEPNPVEPNPCIFS